MIICQFQILTIFQVNEIKLFHKNRKLIKVLVKDI